MKKLKKSQVLREGREAGIRFAIKKLYEALLNEGPYFDDNLSDDFEEQQRIKIGLKLLFNIVKNSPECREVIEKFVRGVTSDDGYFSYDAPEKFVKRMTQILNNPRGKNVDIDFDSDDDEISFIEIEDNDIISFKYSFYFNKNRHSKNNFFIKIKPNLLRIFSLINDGLFKRIIKRLRNIISNKNKNFVFGDEDLYNSILFYFEQLVVQNYRNYFDEEYNVEDEFEYAIASETDETDYTGPEFQAAEGQANIDKNIFNSFKNSVKKMKRYLNREDGED